MKITIEIGERVLTAELARDVRRRAAEFIYYIGDQRYVGTNEEATKALDYIEGLKKAARDHQPA